MVSVLEKCLKPLPTLIISIQNFRPAKNSCTRNDLTLLQETEPRCCGAPWRFSFFWDTRNERGWLFVPDHTVTVTSSWLELEVVNSWEEKWLVLAEGLEGFE
jgi:hypothetical protein